MIALANARIYTDPFAPPLDDAAVIIDGATIRSAGPSQTIPPGAHVIDCCGGTIVAGFWNAHVHFFERKWSDARAISPDDFDVQLSDFTRFGFTSVFDLSSAFENTKIIRERIERGDVRGPAVYTTGEGIVPAGFSIPDTVYALLGQTKTALPEAATPAEARTHVRGLAEKGVDAIKLFASTPQGALTVETMAAAVEEAHAAGLPVFVHPNTMEDVERAAKAGADIIAHTTPRSSHWDARLMAEMIDRGVALTPTLHLWRHFARHDRHSDMQRQVDAAISQLRAWWTAGGIVIFGTDYGAVGADPFAEYRSMHEAGMSFSQILASLTTAPSERFGGVRRGRVAEGFQADLTVLGGDPAIDLRALVDVRYTMRNGKILFAARP